MIRSCVKTHRLPGTIWIIVTSLSRHSERFRIDRHVSELDVETRSVRRQLRLFYLDQKLSIVNYAQRNTNDDESIVFNWFLLTNDNNNVDKYFVRKTRRQSNTIGSLVMYTHSRQSLQIFTETTYIHRCIASFTSRVCR
jgi:hypothetical protein